MSAPGDTTYDGAIDISSDAAVAALVEAPDHHFRFVVAKYFVVEEFFHAGLWRSLCRTDECDDVCTFGEREPEEFPQQSQRDFWTEKARRGYGARVGPDRFAIIDAMTDG